MATTTVQDIALHTEPLPDGVRYVLPRRRRRGWLAAVRSVVINCVLYFFIPTMFVAALLAGAPRWVLLLAILSVAWFLTLLVAAVRTAIDLLLIPSVTIELRTGRIVVIHSVLGRLTTREVPRAEVRRLTICSLLDQEAAVELPPPPPRPGVLSGLRRMFRHWFHSAEAEEQARGERRKLEELRFFGALTIEGEGDARMLVAEGYGLCYLRALANDVASRLDDGPSPITVQESGPAPKVISPDDRRLARPDQVTNIKAGPTIFGFTIEAPPSSLAGLNAVPMLFAAVGMFTAGTLFVSGLPDELGWQKLPALLFVVGFSGTGFVLFFGFIQRCLRMQLRTFFHVNNGLLVVRYESPVGGWKHAWVGSEVAAFTSQQRRITQSGKPIFVYDLLLLDHAMRSRVLLRDRLEAEVDWVVAVLHHELELGM